MRTRLLPYTTAVCDYRKQLGRNFLKGQSASCIPIVAHTMREELMHSLHTHVCVCIHAKRINTTMLINDYCNCVRQCFYCHFNMWCTCILVIWMVSDNREHRRVFLRTLAVRNGIRETSGFSARWSVSSCSIPIRGSVPTPSVWVPAMYRNQAHHSQWSIYIFFPPSFTICTVMHFNILLEEQCFQ